MMTLSIRRELIGFLVFAFALIYAGSYVSLRFTFPRQRLSLMDGREYPVMDPTKEYPAPSLPKSTHTPLNKFYSPIGWIDQRITGERLLFNDWMPWWNTTGN
jgi:hypothetical protein